MGFLWKVVSKLVGYFVYYKRGGVAYARRRGISVGEGCRVYTRLEGTEPFLVSIGSRVTITADVKLITHDGSTWLVRDENDVRCQRYAAINIGDDVFIGVGTIVLPGVNIGSKVVIGSPIPSFVAHVLHTPCIPYR